MNLKCVENKSLKFYYCNKLYLVGYFTFKEVILFVSKYPSIFQNK